jgi:hypothetical protein
VSIPGGAELVDLVDLLVALRDHGVTGFTSGDLHIVLAASSPLIVSPKPVVSTQPSTPEHSGTTDALLAEKSPEMFDIYDVSPGRRVPGAPTLDGFPVDPSTG